MVISYKQKNRTETLEASSVGSVAPALSNAWVSLATITLTPGTWSVIGGGGILHGTATGLSTVAIGISTTPNAVDTQTRANLQSNPQAGANITYSSCTRNIVVAPGTTQVVYAVGLIIYTTVGTATWSTTGFISAIKNPS